MAKNFRKSFVAALRANTDLAAKVGTQISSSYAPKSFIGVWVTFSKVSGNEPSAHDGNSGPREHRYQLTIASAIKTAVDDVAEILISQFNGASYTAFPSTGNEQELTFFHEDDQETWEEAPRSYLATVDLRVQANL